MQTDVQEEGKNRLKGKPKSGSNSNHSCYLEIAHCYRLRVSLIEFLITRRLLVGIGEDASGSSLLGSLCDLDVSIVGIGIGLVAERPSTVCPSSPSKPLLFGGYGSLHAESSENTSVSLCLLGGSSRDGE